MQIDAPWLRAPETQQVLALLTDAGHGAFVVGGCVRDAILERPVSDIDVATDAPPVRVMALAKAAGLKALPTGIDHGTITVVAGKQAFEVTTFRRDVATDGRRAVVAFASDIADDARRRDFTMNALYAQSNGEVVDPLCGLSDLRARRVRFIEDPARRISEDALRILRFFRFHAWYGDPAAGLDTDAIAAVVEGAAAVENLSLERIGAEVTRLLAAPNPAPAAAAMATTGVLPRVLPGADARVLSPLCHIENTVEAAPHWPRRLVAMGAAAQAARKLRLSRTDARKVAQIAAALALPGAEAAYRQGAAAARDAALIQGASQTPPCAPNAQTLADLDDAAVQRFPFTAADLPPGLEGPSIGAALRDAEARWIASGFRATRADLFE